MYQPKWRAPLYKNKYRIPSARWNKWDYSWDGHYFITICTHNNECFFGEIEDAKMILSPTGKIIEEEWKKTFSLRSYLILDEYIVMPNHFHAILGIQRTTSTQNETPQRGVCTTRQVGTHTNIAIEKWQKDSLGSIVNQFKGACTKRIWKIGYTNFLWHPKFHDRIIRDEFELNRIRKYVRENPQKWEDDELYTE